MKLSIQLYTVRDLTAKDFPGTMKKLAGIGYRAVELAGYGNLKTAQEAKAALDEAGLKVSGAHAPIDQLETKLDQILAEATELGHTNIICPWMPEERRKTAEDWKKAAKSLEKIGYECHQKGFQLCYHNHSFEFQKFEGKRGFDILFENCDANMVKCELDVYWVQHGGEDPVKLINRMGERIHLMHLKDMAKGPEKKFAPVGTGIIDFKGILEAGTKAQTQWGCVEQDNSYGADPLEAVKTSFENLTKLGLSAS
ncbi:MAG TPA: sugar phosphate isomerase/epimerase [Tepidisphaeraceae bacterium]|jgi:sugar phosphate isomerase/epimerase